MIKIKDLEKIYRTDEVETVALNKLSMEVKEGEFVAVMGPSGCGKSTLLNILGLLDDPDAGSFVFNGTEVAHFNERQRADLRKHNIGFVFQSFNLIDELTVFENVELPLIYTGVKSADRKVKVEEVLQKMQIMHRRNHYPQQLSGGQQQRVAVARAVVKGLDNRQQRLIETSRRILWGCGECSPGPIRNEPPHSLPDLGALAGG